MMKVVLIAPFSEGELREVRSIDSRLEVVYAWEEFVPEIRKQWGPHAASMFMRPSKDGDGSRLTSEAKRERDRLLAEADVICLGFPFPKDVRARTSRVQWVHIVNAGASNLLYGDLWGAPIQVTTTRGHRSQIPIAEYVLTAVFLFAKGIVGRERVDRLRSGRSQVQGKTLGIIGFGGIGRAVGGLAKGVGMRVIATKRAVGEAESYPGEADTVLPASEMGRLLQESDFVAVCSQWTPSNTRTIGERELKQMKPTAVLINIARGELIDEDALIHALKDGTIAGAALDVYDGEFDHPPRQELITLPNVYFTPHVSGSSDVPSREPLELFCENLRRYLSGKELLNVIDWERGY